MYENVAYSTWEVFDLYEGWLIKKNMVSRYHVGQELRAFLSIVKNPNSTPENNSIENNVVVTHSDLTTADNNSPSTVAQKVNHQYQVKDLITLWSVNRNDFMKRLYFLPT